MTTSNVSQSPPEQDSRPPMTDLERRIIEQNAVRPIRFGVSTEAILHMTFTDVEFAALLKRHSNSGAKWPVAVEAKLGKLSPTSLALWMRTVLQLELDRLVRAELSADDIAEIEAQR